ncbi:MAG: hypothetical protein KBD16_02340 [Candidatus Pacebacteria bacterium]|nr:hypothetical protein [Candidatus Paceibacterota bacterium]
MQLHALENIAELWQKGKYWASGREVRQEAFELLIVLAVGLGAFACGRLSVIESKAVPVAVRAQISEYNSQNTLLEQSTSSSSKTGKAGQGQGIGALPAPGSVLGSRNGTKYHFPWCSGAQTIKEENKVWFASEKDAQSAGYTKAANCE